MKKAGIFCIRALCVIFVGVILGCSGGGGGGSEIEDNGVNNGDQQGGQQQGGNGGQEQGGNQQGNGEQQTGWQEPDFYINEELSGQRFVETNADWFYYKQDVKDQQFADHYSDASQYIDNKVAELQKLWQQNNTGSALSNQIGTALNNYNTVGTSIADHITNNYAALAPVFATMEDSLIKDEDCNRYAVSYYKLAADAYKNSLGGGKDSIGFTVNKQMANTSDSFFNTLLPNANLSYTEAANNAKPMMNSNLRTIATETNTNHEVLKKVVELFLYNESLYGLNDFANREKVKGTFRDMHNITAFDYYIEIARKNAQQSIDDRTM